jgi:predicted site-specific integrase-resolvase
MDYAIKKGVSLSTLRRHIKANKIPYRVENGRYLLLNETTEEKHDPEANLLRVSLRKVEMDLQRAQEEIAELKTLIALYEEKLPPQKLDS